MSIIQEYLEKAKKITGDKWTSKARNKKKREE